MEEILKSRFTKEELELAASLGLGGADIKDKIQALFSQLSDPLLAINEIIDLLNMKTEEKAALAAVQSLLGDEFLESSITTQRPLDTASVTLYRRKDAPLSRLKILATASRLYDQEYRYEFTIDGRLIRPISIVDRLDAAEGTGNQRDEIIRHVKNIANGIASGTQVPNSVILAFNLETFIMDPDPDESVPASWVVCRSLQSEVSVPHPTRFGQYIQHLRAVELDIPYRNAAFDDEKSAYLVDGQQRTAALSLVDVDVVPSFFLSVNAIVADSDGAKKTFQVANSTVRISTEFSRALIGTMNDAPRYLKKEQNLAQALKKLAVTDPNSPFHNLVKHPGLSKKGTPIAYNTLFSVISTFSEASFFEADVSAEKLATCVSRAFKLVQSVWPAAWGRPATESKLMHGAGLRAIGKVLVDLIETNYKIYEYDLENVQVWDSTNESLNRLASRVQWTATEALGGTNSHKKIYTDEIVNKQNTNQDIQALTSFLSKEITHLDKQAIKTSKS